MAQQINLSSPALQVKPQRFMAQTLAIALAAVLVLGGALSGGYVWKLEQATDSFSQTAALQTKEIDALKSAVAAKQASTVPVDPTLSQQVQSARATLATRLQLKQALLDGRFQPGWGHSDRLRLVAQSIPEPVWVTSVKADATRLEVAGFTLEPAALNHWVARLSDSPLMLGQQLATVQVENTFKTNAPVAAGGAAMPRPQWSFTLVSAQTPPPPKPAASAPGGNP